MPIGAFPVRGFPDRAFPDRAFPYAPTHSAGRAVCTKTGIRTAFARNMEAVVVICPKEDQVSHDLLGLKE